MSRRKHGRWTAGWLMLALVALTVLTGMSPNPETATTAPSESESGNIQHSKFLNVAHRGASGHAPENTLAAFDKAVEMKADYFELDVQRSKDGHLVLMHDTTVDRTTDGTGAVKDLTLTELKALDAGSWFSDKYAGEKIPTLEETLDRYRGTGIKILIELKSPSLYPGIEQQVADMLAEKNLDNRGDKIIVQSFDHDSVQRFHRQMPSVPVGVLVSYTAYKETGVTDDDLDSFAGYADYVNPNKALVDAELVRRVHQHGMKILPYTVRDREAADRLFEAGVDGFITDYPELGYTHHHK
ncbi:glycerophosphoryl diester phosphodiesterase [Melghirimyces profundicolus]|uniref:Glycerophosphoryl diester phosphodiesterase n=1 Tax=Melghirimyces profundicolus TaxID=1242148 RepID=A0A2T6AXH8_9BACL|nr:glycerophosphodiester phosphodiesterase family protein [Melghirimyces profundicolus]PTX48496.1 glycerophosphoryl diester phosphodiesterase [Melghirimyces profundicolus]